MINAESFGSYAVETAKIYVTNYGWYYMPSSVHKILLHGENIIKHFAVLPTGQLSKDAQESRNKDPNFEVFDFYLFIFNFVLQKILIKSISLEASYTTLHLCKISNLYF